MSEQVTRHGNPRREESALTPLVNVVEDTTCIAMYADMPGVPKDKLNIHVDGENLSIEGELSFGVPEGMEAIHAEISLPRYRRVFTLSRELDSKRISAEFKQGVLTLRIPKAEHAQPRKIVVQAS